MLNLNINNADRVKQNPDSVGTKFSNLGWFVVLGLNGPLRQYFSLYRERGRTKTEKIDERKMSKQPPLAPTTSAISHCPTIIQVTRTSLH